MAETGFKGDITDILYIIAMNKKYIFAYRLNYPNKESGKNVSILYFDVVIKLLGNI